jgi:Uma2 family endonuclease
MLGWENHTSAKINVKKSAKNMRKIDYTNRKHLPTMEELPYKDDRPADSELQVLIASLLKSVLAYIWADRNDWFFGKRMGWYYDPDKSAIALVGGALRFTTVHK